MYITPITKVYSTFDEVREFFDKFGGITLGDEKRLTIEDISQGDRNLVVGEPGIGKTILLEKIREYLVEKGTITALISLRRPDSLHQIGDFYRAQNGRPAALLLDALDEVRSSLLPEVIQKVEELSKSAPELSIYLSARWVFINRYAKSFPEFRFILLSPFTERQVREYLVACGHSTGDIDKLLGLMMSFGHAMLVIQIPRYLVYLQEYLKQSGIDAAAQLSRNDLFEYFIYSKLELEEKKLEPADKRAITKRVLEKLALTMEIYQANVISKDELMTFFDDLNSDLKRAALSQVGLEVFFDYSLLKSNIDSIEFENTEFQEYLAAKEITRFADPIRAAFRLSVDPISKDLYPSWFNTFTFLVDMKEEVLEPLIEFSGIRSTSFRAVDEGFLNFLSRISPLRVSRNLRQGIFKDVLGYHQRHLQWLQDQLARALGGFYDSSNEDDLKSWIERSEKAVDAKRYVPLGNVAYVVGHLLRQKTHIDVRYWREKLIEYAGDQNENGVLQRHALFALQHLEDPTVIEELPNLMDSEELIQQTFLELCASLAPDHPKSLEYFFEGVSRDNIYGRLGLTEAKRPSSIKRILREFNDSESFRSEFLEQSFVFKDKDAILIENIEAGYDEEIAELVKTAVIKCLHYNYAHSALESDFIKGLWKLLKRKDPDGFLPEIVDRIKAGGESDVYYAAAVVAQVLDKEEVNSFIDAMLSAQQRGFAVSVMIGIKQSGRESATEMFELGRARLASEYAEYEAQLNKRGTQARDRKAELQQEFRMLLEPEPGKYSQNVFRFYNEHREELDPLAPPDRERLVKLITGSVFEQVKPLEHPLTITAEHEGSRSFSTSTAIVLFGEALKNASHLGLEVGQFRKQILDYIPFAYSEQLRAIFSLVTHIEPGEMADVTRVYKSRVSDLWRHQPISFVEAVEQYYLVEAAPILKELVKEPRCENYVREKALLVLNSVSPDGSFLERVFKSYRKSRSVGERMLGEIANGLLITSHADRESIRWRLKEIVKRAAAFVRPRGAHRVGELEDEITHSKTFAKPLMNLTHPGYEEDYLKVLEKALEIWSRGKEFYQYAGYLWDVVYAYFDNLKEGRSYSPLKQLERKIAELASREGANWLAWRMVNLRRSYLGYLGRPRNIAEAVKKYNEARAEDSKKIANSSDLFRHLEDAVDSDLRRWIEGGAYDLILGPKVYSSRRQQYEDLIQKTVEPQLKIILLKRGIEIDVYRETQLLDNKRSDFLIRYGFVGPIVVEIKLTSNSDMRRVNIESTSSYLNMKQYIKGFEASHGMVLLINNRAGTRHARIRNSFEKIPNVAVRVLECVRDSKHRSRRRGKKVVGRKARQARRSKGLGR